jgi:hypothetical protein
MGQIGWVFDKFTQSADEWHAIVPSNIDTPITSAMFSQYRAKYTSEISTSSKHKFCE